MSAKPNPDHRTNGPDMHRALPHDTDAEQGLLGSMLIAPAEVMDECILRISAEALYAPRHQTIFALLVELWDKQLPADVITLTGALRDRKQLEAVGGPAYISSLIDFTPTAANAGYYLDRVKEKHTLRRIIATCTDYAARAYDDNGEVNALLDQAQADMLGICDAAQPAQDEPRMKDNVMRAIEDIEKLYERRGAVTGLPTGLTELDRLTAGLQAPDMIVIAARPSMGKTALVMNIAEHVATVAKRAVGVFSLEMSTQQLTQRMLCARAHVNLQKVRDGFMSERDFPSLTNAASKLADAPIHIDDTSSLTINALRAKARRWKKKHGIELIVIDYLQLMRSDSRQAQNNREREISEISSGIKALAKELHIPIIVLAQLNRNPEARKGGKPRLSDLRESGSIEQDADVVMLLTRAEQYAEDEEAKEETCGEAELIIAKQRNGPVGQIDLTFIKECTRFEDRAGSRDEAMVSTVAGLGEV